MTSFIHMEAWSCSVMCSAELELGGKGKCFPSAKLDLKKRFVSQFRLVLQSVTAGITTIKGSPT